MAEPNVSSRQVCRSAEPHTSFTFTSTHHYDNQVVALGPMLFDVRSLYYFWKEFASGRGVIAHPRPRDVADGRW
jgi:hypothetical protein